jgi:hypothetical protein
MADKTVRYSAAEHDALFPFDRARRFFRGPLRGSLTLNPPQRTGLLARQRSSLETTREFRNYASGRFPRCCPGGRKIERGEVMPTLVITFKTARALGRCLSLTM